MKIKRVIEIEERDIQEIADYRNGEHRGQLRYEIVSNAFESIAQSIPYEARPQGEWIPVSERLPEENGEYLVTREAYIDRENRRMIIVRDIAYFTINYGLNNGFHKANRVIAWQPLPEPYKKGGAE